MGQGTRPQLERYRLLLFDRDGTLNFEDAGYHRDLAEVKPYPFTGPALQRLRQRFQLGVVTNQSGIGRGFWSAGDVEILHKRLCGEWGITMPFFICPHLPQDDCSCRKPKPGLINDALRHFNVSPDEVLMVGDSVTDLEAATAAGVDFALVLTGRGRQIEKAAQASITIVLDSMADLAQGIEPI